MKSGKKEGVAEMGRKGRRKEEGGGKRGERLPVSLLLWTDSTV